MHPCSALVPCANPAAEFDGPPTVRFDGTYISPLTAPSLRRLLLKPKQHPPRVFSIQKVLATKYGDHSTSIRVSYAKGGKCSVWSMTRREPFIVKTMSPLKQRRAETMTAISSARPEDAPVTHTLEEPPTAESPMRRIRQLRRLDTVLGSMEDQPSPASLRHQSSNLFFVPGEEMGSPLSSPSKRVSVSEQNIEDITNLYDDNNAVCNEEPKRFLDSLSEQNCLIDEMTPLAAEPIFDIVANIARHYSNVFRRTMEQLTIDVAKDANDCYCLVDIVAFRFEDCDIAPAKLPTRIKTRIEIECDCILDAFRSHLDPAQVHAALIMEGDAHEGGTKASKIDWNAQAVGAAPCSMCESKLPPDQLCYAITSTLIQSTIIHMRSRLPQKYWPNFCRDNCFAVRSMNRIEGDPFNIKGLTVADIRICSLCYEICNKEMALVEIEQKLSKFTRTTKERSVDQRPEVLARSATAASIGTAKETLLDGCSTMSPPKPNVVPNPIAKSDWNPTENFRMRNRPSVLVKIAAALDTSKKLNKQASEPVLKPKRMTVGPGDLKMAPNSRPRSAGLARTPNHPSPIRRHDSSQQIPSVSAATGATPSKSMASTGRITRMRKLDQEEHIPAQGRSVVRSSLNENMTMCRALVGIQQVQH